MFRPNTTTAILYDVSIHNLHAANQWKQQNKRKLKKIFKNPNPSVQELELLWHYCNWKRIATEAETFLQGIRDEPTAS